ncbi:hypothetical protein GcC1_207047, partial [Golovinomyces cichoracearum]
MITLKASEPIQWPANDPKPQHLSPEYLQPQQTLPSPSTSQPIMEVNAKSKSPSQPQNTSILQSQSVNPQQEAFNTSRSSKDVRATPDFNFPTAPPPQAMIYQNQQLHPQQP